MRTFVAVTVVATLFVVVAACGHKDDSAQPTTPTATATYGAGYPPGYPPATGQPPPPGYPGTYNTAQPPPPQPTYPPPQPTATPTGTAGGAMAVPGPLALPCQNDASCGLHHCNTQYSKCAFPCASAADCISPNQCIMGVCLPAPPPGGQGH